MSERKHTLGPWAYEFYAVGSAERAGPRWEWSGLTIGREDDERPGQVLRSLFEGGVTHDRSDGDPEADARLIASAPDLLKALKDVEWAGRANGACPQCDRRQQEGHQPNCALANAIAKAEGRSA